MRAQVLGKRPRVLLGNLMLRLQPGDDVRVLGKVPRVLLCSFVLRLLLGYDGRVLGERAGPECSCLQAPACMPHLAPARLCASLPVHGTGLDDSTLEATYGLSMMTVMMMMVMVMAVMVMVATVRIP